MNSTYLNNIDYNYSEVFFYLFFRWKIIIFMDITDIILQLEGILIIYKNIVK